jgi:hypothetical protein
MKQLVEKDFGKISEGLSRFQITASAMDSDGFKLRFQQRFQLMVSNLPDFVLNTRGLIGSS